MAAATPSLSLNSDRWFTVADGSQSNQDLGVHGRRWFTDLGVQSMVHRSAKKMVVACRVDVHGCRSFFYSFFPAIWWLPWSSMAVDLVHLLRRFEPLLRGKGVAENDGGGGTLVWPCVFQELPTLCDLVLEMEGAGAPGEVCGVHEKEMQGDHSGKGGCAAQEKAPTKRGQRREADEEEGIGEDGR
ncbi:hypothetical protein L6452_03557 [Arctium lappa]|uniref:Uncharacterized protein n=1 Tax=Arctium lappa TaxID=4217 RepID=A0ACB9FMP5_ARCLA|nr:hypothetical protein L6452_03557 [Arctium lappa]